MLQDTVVIPTTKNGMPTYSPTGSANAEDVIADDRYRQGSAKFGYVVWLADNSVFDIAGNSFAGSGKYFFFFKMFFFLFVSQVHYRFIKKHSVVYIKTNYLFLKKSILSSFIFFYLFLYFYLTFFFETDMDLDGVVFVNLAQEKYCGFSCWFPFVIAGIVGVMVAGFVGYELHKRSKGESTCLCNRDGNNKSENSFFSSSGYVAVEA